MNYAKCCLTRRLFNDGRKQTSTRVKYRGCFRSLEFRQDDEKWLRFWPRKLAPESKGKTKIPVTISPISRPLWMIRNMVKFLRHEVVSTSPNRKAERQPLVGCPRQLIQCICSYPPYMEVVPPSATWGRAMTWWQGPIIRLIKSSRMR